jgi:hypothetical protein
MKKENLREKRQEDGGRNWLAVKRRLNIYRTVNAIFTAKMVMVVKNGKNRLDERDI